jgi:hypothetical protein
MGRRCASMADALSDGTSYREKWQRKARYAFR